MLDLDKARKVIAAEAAFKSALAEVNAASLKLMTLGYEPQIHGWGPQAGSTSYLRPQGELALKLVQRDRT